jgi:hypothetical protein
MGLYRIAKTFNDSYMLDQIHAQQPTILCTEEWGLTYKGWKTNYRFWIWSNICEPEYKAKVLFPETIKRPNWVRREMGSGPIEMAMEEKKTNQPCKQ